MEAADKDNNGVADEAEEVAAPSVDALQAELTALQDRFVRQAAEFQNYRRRTEQEKSMMVDFGKQAVVMQILDVVDDFRRSLDAAEQVGDAPEPSALPDAYASLHKGVALVYGKLLGELAKIGVETIAAVGEVFDEEEHEALMSQPADEQFPEGTIVSEIQTGYRMGGRVLRHARVVVSS